VLEISERATGNEKVSGYPEIFKNGATFAQLHTRCRGFCHLRLTKPSSPFQGESGIDYP
jgi:hypothetical protein